MEILNEYYTGIGSRKTPDNILRIMSELGRQYKDKYVLRSGGAPGADLAFEKLIDEREATIFLPWKTFNDHPSNLCTQSKEAFEIASKHHKAWEFLKTPVRKLMARNVHQVLGINLDKPSKFLVCWTPDGASTIQEITAKTGGTGLAISVACEYNIPIYNLGKDEILKQFIEHYNLKEIYESI